MPRIDNSGHDWTLCKKWAAAKLHHPKTREIRDVDGLEFTAWYYWPWENRNAADGKPEDARSCMTQPIRNVNCAGDISFKNGGCYMR